MYCFIGHNSLGTTQLLTICLDRETFSSALTFQNEDQSSQEIFSEACINIALK
jgi:hypothetical protein